MQLEILYSFTGFIFRAAIVLIASLCAKLTAETYQLEHQQAANYTHLRWSTIDTDKLSINIKPIKNFSGLAIAQKNTAANYHHFAKLPDGLNQLNQQVFLASNFFKIDFDNPSYIVELSLDN